MRNKLIVLSAVLFLIALSFAGKQALKLENDRYHQHLAVQGGAPLDTSLINASTYAPQSVVQEGFVSHLPLITIDTHGQTIPGSLYSDTERVGVTMRFFDADGSGAENNSPNREPDTESLANIRYRGHSSRAFDKKGYSIRLAKPGGIEENHQPLFGMPAHDEWVLHGPFMDKTLLRNYLMYNLSGQVMDWAPNVRLCELFVDGAYQGVYLLAEDVSVGGERINLRKSRAREEFTSYLVEIVHASRIDPRDPSLLNNFTAYSALMPPAARSVVCYPAAKNITPAQFKYIQGDISRFEHMLYSYDYDDSALGYHGEINMRSFVDYVVINEFCMNFDAGNYSTFIFRDAKGDFDICVWDFNNAFGNYTEETDPSDFYFRGRIWFDMFLKDEEFVRRVVDRYRELRSTWLNEDYLMEYIDGAIAYLGSAIERNFTVWGESFLPENGLLLPAERNHKSYDEAVEQLKAAIRERGAFLDRNIESFYQFCHASKVKPYNP